MKIRQLSFWAAVVVVGCNGKLTVPDDPNAAGAAGEGGEIGVAGHGDIGVAGDRPTGAGGHGGEVGVAGAHPVDSGGHGNSVAGSGGMGVAGRDFGTGGWNASGGSTPAEGGWGNNGGTGPSGGSGPGPAPGTLGQPCIPGGLVTEAEGSPAKTQIKNLPRCYEGLSCNSDSKCVPTPDCPQNEALCVVRHATLPAGSGGLPDQGWGGASSSGGSSPVWSNGGAGQQLYYASDKTGVTAMTASDSRVYWVEYGTRDALGNYQHDGALLAYSPDDGTTTVVASGLEGPTDVAITTTHAYVYVDGARPSGTFIRAQLLRVPLAGGNAELVQDGAIPASFAADGSRAFWSTDYTLPNQNIYSMTSDSNAVPTTFVAGDAFKLAIDGSDLYYKVGSGLMRTPTANAAPVAVNVSVGEYVLHDDSIYTLESVNGGLMLSLAPKTGGETTRVRALGYSYPLKLRRLGDRYFVESQPTGSPSQRQLLTASFVGTDPPVRLIGPSRGWAGDRLWAATATTLYWSEGRAVYKQPLTTP
ncbi:MAG TPA: hypothetical protein VER96_08290 [Polyangiaceae bacterium]|nr:hypothetical protein [Polyangiaceae bacterium]